MPPGAPKPPRYEPPGQRATPPPGATTPIASLLPRWDASPIWRPLSPNSTASSLPRPPPRPVLQEPQGSTARHVGRSSAIGDGVTADGWQLKREARRGGERIGGNGGQN